MATNSYNSYSTTATTKDFTPFKKYTFPAGELGGEIRLTIPLQASAEDVATVARMLAVIAETWKGVDD